MERDFEPIPQRFTLIAEPVADDAWHLSVVELPATWTVAFGRDDIERAARFRIGLDLGIDPTDVEVTVHHRRWLQIERRSHHRDDGR